VTAVVTAVAGAVDVAGAVATAVATAAVDSLFALTLASHWNSWAELLPEGSRQRLEYGVPALPDRMSSVKPDCSGFRTGRWSDDAS
jgi:hypothetical protein